MVNYAKLERTDTMNERPLEGIVVDASCTGNPGAMEYRGVHADTQDVLFQSPVYPIGTNNLGEFLAVVDAMKYLHEKGDTTTPIYSDSQTALIWVRRKHPNTNLPRNAQTEMLFQQLESATH